MAVPADLSVRLDVELLQCLYQVCGSAAAEPVGPDGFVGKCAYKAVGVVDILGRTGGWGRRELT